MSLVLRNDVIPIRSEGSVRNLFLAGGGNSRFLTGLSAKFGMTRIF
jgi:hypothetical protein